jgi:biotin transport system substrate-specific component
MDFIFSESDIMTRPATHILDSHERSIEWARQVALVVGASLFIAVCARVTVPLPFTPVPLTIQNLGVLLVGLTLGSKRGLAALALYLMEGASGMPVFSLGAAGLGYMTGVTAGFLLAYPFVAWLAGWVMERGNKTFARALMAGLVAEILLFACGLSWLAVLTHSISTAVRFGLYWFVFAEVIKIMLAAGIATGWERTFKAQA